MTNIYTGICICSRKSTRIIFFLPFTLLNIHRNLHLSIYKENCNNSQGLSPPFLSFTNTKTSASLKGNPDGHYFQQTIFPSAFWNKLCGKWIPKTRVIPFLYVIIESGGCPLPSTNWRLKKSKRKKGMLILFSLTSLHEMLSRPWSLSRPGSHCWTGCCRDRRIGWAPT